MKIQRIDIFKLLFLFYLLALIKIILFKYPLLMLISAIKQTDIDILQRRLLQSNLVPLKMILYYLMNWENSPVSRINIIANIVSFMPLGFMAPIILGKDKIFKKVAILALSLSLGFELFQLIFGMGNFDIDDLILNIVGI